MSAATKTSGNSPQAMPSLRLLTRPAWLTLDRLRSVSEVRRKISRCVSATTGSTDAFTSSATWCRVSRTASIDSNRPVAT